MRTLRRTLLLLLIPAMGIGCSDGGNGGEGLTDPPAGGNETPTATIQTPDHEAVFDAGDPILFQGFGQDAEEGTLPAGSLIWSSDVDGDFGSGNAFNMSQLSEGDHVITLTAVDSQGAQGTSSVSLTIAPEIVLDITGRWLLTGDDGTDLTADLVQNETLVTGDWTSAAGAAGTASLNLIGQNLQGQIQRTVPSDVSFDFEATVDETGATMAGSYTSTSLGDFNFTVNFTGSIQP